MAASSSSGKISPPDGVISSKRGLTPATKKNNFPEIHTDSVSVAKLNSVCVRCQLSLPGDQHAVGRKSDRAGLWSEEQDRGEHEHLGRRKVRFDRRHLQREASAQQRQRGEDQEFMRNAISNQREDTVRPERDANRRDGGHVGASAARECVRPLRAHAGLMAASDGGITPHEMVRIGMFGVSPYKVLP